MQEKNKIYTVSQVNSLIKGILRNNLPRQLIIKGETSGWKVGPKGHRYFSLKDVDVNSELPCAMWNYKFAKVKFRPENGMAVLATGFISVYIPGGKYTFVVDELQPEGVGARQLAFEQMKKKLQAQGFFDEARKKVIPKYPRRIGILTSESGAAVEDIKDSIWNRWPPAGLFLYPVPVQGENAAEKIAAGIRDINRRNKKLKLDVLIVGRGGGSPEDLWAFNEEVLARAIFDSAIPVISAVGHEVDVTIADLVADARASTPTKAGVVAVPDIQEVMRNLANAQSRLFNQAKATLRLAQENLKTILASSTFQRPLLLVRNAEQQLDELNAELSGAIKALIIEARGKLHSSYEQVVKIEPHRLLGQKAVQLNNLNNAAMAAIGVILNKRKLQLTANENRLLALNPKSVLHRGYSITTSKKTGLLVKKPGDVQIADYIITELAGQNLIESKVTKK